MGKQTENILVCADLEFQQSGPDRFDYVMLSLAIAQTLFALWMLYDVWMLPGNGGVMQLQPPSMLIRISWSVTTFDALYFPWAIASVLAVFGAIRTQANRWRWYAASFGVWAGMLLAFLASCMILNGSDRSYRWVPGAGLPPESWGPVRMRVKRDSVSSTGLFNLQSNYVAFTYQEDRRSLYTVG